MNNSEKLGTQDEDKQNKNTTQYVLDTTIHKTILILHKRRLLLQTIGSIGEPNIVFILMDKNDGITTEIHNEFFTLSIQHTE